jgi:hypothetical protein
MSTHSILYPTLLACVALAAGGPGCGTGEESGPSVTPSLDDPTVALGSSTRVIEFLAHVSPKSRSVTFTRVQDEAHGAPALPGLSPQSVDDLTIDQDNSAGSGAASTVELVTNSVGTDGACPSGHTTSSFCANVTLRHFYPRSLANVFMQVVWVKDYNMVSLPDHAGINSDASELGLANTYGLWKYTAPAATTPGVLGQSPDNDGARDWIFANPDNADTLIKLRVVASLSYSSYVMGGSSTSFVDACAVGTNLGKPANVAQTMPFPFTLYSATSATVHFNPRGMITFGAVGGTSSGSNVKIPSGLAPKPGLFAFWDDIGYGAAGTSALCYATLGSAPNRKYVVTWRQMNFIPVADQAASLTFSTFLSEGTNAIDLVYNTMTGPTSRATGSSATVGVQNATAAVATQVYNTSSFGSGTAYSLSPVP